MANYGVEFKGNSAVVRSNSRSTIVFALRLISFFGSIAIEFKGCRLRDIEAKVVAEFLKVNTYTLVLDLTANCIGGKGAKALADALKVNQTLAVLDLTTNCIGDKGAKTLADALMINKMLAVLDLTLNMIGDDGTEALADALKTNKTLKKLVLQKNRICSRGAKALAGALLRSKTLISLYLNSNNIENDGLEAVVKALQRNFSLWRRLEVGGQVLLGRSTQLSKHCLCTTIDALLHRNRNLNKNCNLKWTSVDERIYCLFIGLHAVFQNDVYLNLAIVDHLPYFCTLDRARKVALLQEIFSQSRLLIEK